MQAPILAFLKEARVPDCGEERGFVANATYSTFLPSPFWIDGT